MLLDLGLPDIMGEVVLATIRFYESNTHRHLFVIVATAHGDVATLQECCQKGADAAFIKPITLEQLKKTIKDLQFPEDL
jgi:CheY-like chemotaxis protein